MQITHNHIYLCVYRKYLNCQKNIKKYHHFGMTYFHLGRHLIIHLITITSYQASSCIDIVYSLLAHARAHHSF